MLFETRIHGRGGQGVVTAAELLSVAAFLEGKHAQAFPTFGSERMGAPIVSFCRISDAPVRSREPILEPSALVVQDPTLLHQLNLFAGVGADAYVLINTARDADELDLGDLLERLRAERVLTIPAGEIAREHLGRALPNAALLGAFAGLCGVVGIDAVARAIEERFPGAVGERNVAAARAAHAAAIDRLEAVHA